MPDHVHTIFSLTDGQTLKTVMHAFGSHTGRQTNQLLGRSGQFWQRGYYEHQIRDEYSLAKHMEYILGNPVRMGYVQRPEDWPFSGFLPRW